MQRNILSTRKNIHFATAIISYLAVSFRISSVDAYHAVSSNLYQYPGLVVKGSLDTSGGQRSYNGTTAEGRNDDGNIDSGAAGVYATGLILCLIGIYYDVWIIFHESRNSTSNSNLPRFSRSTRRAAIQSILRIQTFSETTHCITVESRNGGFGASYYGSISSGVGDSLSCPICLDDYCGDQLVVSSSRCNHIFHKDCVLEWLEKHETCPCCRIPLVTQNEIIKAVKEKKKTQSTSAILV